MPGRTSCSPGCDPSNFFSLRFLLVASQGLVPHCLEGRAARLAATPPIFSLCAFSLSRPRAWFLIAWKDELLDCVTSRLEGGKGDEGGEQAIARVLVPLSNLLTWVGAAAAALVVASFGHSALHCLCSVHPLC